MPQIVLKINGLDKFRAAAEKFPAVAEKHFRVGIERALIAVNASIKTSAPVFRGILRDSFRWQVGRFRGIIGTKLPYAWGIEHGRPPHFVSPTDPDFSAWARQKGVSPYAVSKSIAKKGTKADPLFGAAAKASRKIVEKQLKDAMRATLKEVAR